jgi:hypothetical protein
MITALFYVIIKEFAKQLPQTGFHLLFTILFSENFRVVVEICVVVFSLENIIKGVHILLVF